jgi:hypothetical protein
MRVTFIAPCSRLVRFVLPKELAVAKRLALSNLRICASDELLPFEMLVLRRTANSSSLFNSVLSQSVGAGASRRISRFPVPLAFRCASSVA